jgi:cell division control protein 7
VLQKIPELSRHFVLEGKIGEGTFAKVFRARMIQNKDKKFALKYPISTIRPNRIAEEMRYLRDLGGVDNVCGLEGCILSDGHAVMILPYFPHDKFQDYMLKMDMNQIREYMRSLLKALARIHSMGIVHRDVKPSNFLYCYETGQCLLVDFGLAQEEKELINMKKKLSFVGPKTNLMNMKENDKQPVRIMAPSQVVGKPENKQIVLKKRTMNETTDRKSKKLKSTDGTAVLVETSVLNTPVTPSNALPGEVCKDPENNVFKTPTRQNVPSTPVKSAATQHSSVIPETPQKAVAKDGTRPRMQAKRLMGPADTPKSRLQDTSRLKCECFNKAQVCAICESKHEAVAPRAGTPGFRAPEVLLRSLDQSAAIDVWSAGVMFISLMSGRYPFFRNAEDMQSMAEIISLMGSKRVMRAARRLDKSITLLPAECPPMDLRQVCTSLRPAEHQLTDVPDSAFKLMDSLLDPSPLKRITAELALKHDFFTGDSGGTSHRDM